MQKVTLKTNNADFFTERDKAAQALSSGGKEQFIVARSLYNIQSAKMYRDVGYRTFVDFVNGELEITAEHARRYARVGRRFVEQGYSNVDAEYLMAYATLMGCDRVLAAASKKLKLSTFLKRASTRTYTEYSQMNFPLVPDEIRDVERVLTHYGMEIDDNGRRHNLSQALVSAMEDLRKARKIK